MTVTKIADLLLEEKREFVRELVTKDPNITDVSVASAESVFWAIKVADILQRLEALESYTVQLNSN